MIELISTEFKELVISFPPTKFGYNLVNAKEYEKNTPDKLFDEDVAKSLSKSSYPNLEFHDWRAYIEEEPTPDKPWSLDLIRKTRAYSQGQIIEPSDAIKRQQRIDTGEISAIKPDDFNKKYKIYLEGFEVLKKENTFNTTEECTEFIGAMDEIVNIYDIVNVVVPKPKPYTKSHVAEIKATKVLILVAIEDFFDLKSK